DQSHNPESNHRPSCRSKQHTLTIVFSIASVVSKNIFQRELHDSRTAACRADEKARGAGGDLAKRSGIAQSLARVIEPHGIGDVERLRPKLHAVTLTNREFSRDGFIPFPISGPQNIVRA